MNYVTNETRLPSDALVSTVLLRAMCVLVLASAFAIAGCGSSSDSPGDGAGGQVGGGDPGDGNVGSGGNPGAGGSPGDGGNDPDPKSGCDPDPCVLGTCIEDGGEPFCECELGWTGDRCNEPEPFTDRCEPNPCSNGSCSNTRDESFECECDLGWAGELCDEPIEDLVDHCESTPCENGVCVNRNDGFLCDCAFGWGGELCDELVDHCDPDPCVNGSCRQTADDFVCLCEPGFAGPKCNQPVDDEQCAPSPCANGRCVPGVVEPTCECFAGWTGDRCTVADTTECDLDCEVGACVVDRGVPSCDCVQGWTGELCDESADLGISRTLQINECLVELIAPTGWTEQRSGVYAASEQLAFRVVGSPLPPTALPVVPGTSIVFDENARRLTTDLAGLPFPLGPVVTGAALVFDTLSPVRLEVQNGEEISDRLDPVFVPIPDSREVLVLQTDYRAFGLEIPATPGSPLLELVASDVAVSTVAFDPCEPLNFASVADPALAVLETVPAAPLDPYLMPTTPSEDRDYTQLSTIGTSADRHLFAETGRELFDGSTKSIEGHLYMAASLPPTPNVPVAIEGAVLLDLDPHDNSPLSKETLRQLLHDGDISRAVFSGTVPPSMRDYRLLANGWVGLTLPVPSQSPIAQVFETNGLPLEATISDSTVLIDASDVSSDGPSIDFAMMIDGNPFGDNRIGELLPDEERKIVGYFDAMNDWGFRATERLRIFAPGPEVDAMIMLAVMGDDEAELSMEGTFDLGEVYISVVDQTIQFGEVPITFYLDFISGQVCGSTGFEGPGVSCGAEVCLGPDDFVITPHCELPRGAPCVSDAGCTSGRCNPAIPDPTCQNGCSAAENGCNSACDTALRTCDGACTVAENGCNGACRGTKNTCEAVCDGTHSSCDSTCAATGNTCRGVCNATESACETGCNQARNGCRGRCSSTATTCRAQCSTANSVCDGTCNATQTACVSACSAGTSLCAAARTTCRASCNGCGPLNPFCPDRNACLDDCDDARDQCIDDLGIPQCEAGCQSAGNTCRGVCTSTETQCESTCNGTESLCEGTCEAVLGACNQGCTSAGNACRVPCNATQSSCQTACDQQTVLCDDACASASSSCEAACRQTSESCSGTCDGVHGQCGSACESTANVCAKACDDVRFCD